jgi:hypothetical protein
MSASFQPGAFQLSGFQLAGLLPTSTLLLTKPVNCALLQDMPEPGDRTHEINPMNKRDRIIATNGGTFSEGNSTFTTKTGRGYD